jgi:hypothetical protein
LLGQWINAWRPSANDDDDGVHIILEDDLEMSRHFPAWFLRGHRLVKQDDSVVAVTGQRPQLRAKGQGTMKDAIELLPSAPQAVLYRLMATWSWSPKKTAWMEFRRWYSEQRARGTIPRVPGIVPDAWYAEFLAKNKADERMWEMWVIAWMAQRYPTSFVLYPWLQDGTTVAGNHREAGQNYDGSMGLDHPLAKTQIEVPTMQQIPRLDWDGLPMSTEASKSQQQRLAPRTR